MYVDNQGQYWRKYGWSWQYYKLTTGAWTYAWPPSGLRLLAAGTAPNLANMVFFQVDGVDQIGIVGPTGASGTAIRVRCPVSTAMTLPVAAGTDYLVLLSGSSAAPKMPSAVGNTCRYTIKDVDADLTPKTITTTGGQTIEGQSSWMLVEGGSVDVISDNANWWLV